jgi:hypothetical protein
MKRTRKRPVPRVPAIYIWNGDRQVVTPRLELFFLRQSFPSVRIREQGRKDDNAHLDMSLAKFPLHLVILPNVKVGLGRGYGREILFPTRVKRSFVLNIHGERSRGVEVVEGGKSERALWIQSGF